MKRTFLAFSTLAIGFTACGPDRYEFHIPVEHEVFIPKEVSIAHFVYLSDTVFIDSLLTLMDMNALAFEDIDRITADSVSISVMSPDSNLFGFKQYEVSIVSVNNPTRQMLIGYMYNPPFVQGPGFGSGVVDSLDSLMYLQTNKTDLTDWVINDSFQTRFATEKAVLPWNSTEDFVLKVKYQLFVEASK